MGESFSLLCLQKNGFSYNYSEEGFLLNKFSYGNDTIQGTSFSYFNDLSRVEYEKPFESGVLNGRGYQFARDGRIVGIITYEKGVVKSMQTINKYNSKNEKVGLWITYYDDVTDRKAKLLEGRYKFDLKNGYFRENPDAFSAIVYSDAVELKEPYHRIYLLVVMTIFYKEFWKLV